MSLADITRNEGEWIRVPIPNSFSLVNYETNQPEIASGDGIDGNITTWDIG